LLPAGIKAAMDRNTLMLDIVAKLTLLAVAAALGAALGSWWPF
jgi:hypothetical protein